MAKEEQKKEIKKKSSNKQPAPTSKKEVQNKSVKKEKVVTKNQVEKKSVKEEKLAKENEIKLTLDKEIKSKIPEEKEENDKKRKYIIIILLLLLLCIFGASITFGKQIYDAVSEQIIEVLNLKKPSAPTITGGSRIWATERLIKVEKDAEAEDGLAYYEYCVREEESAKKCEWKKTETKNTKVTTTGMYYVTFRAVDNEGRRGYNSNTEVVYIDNNNPVIKNVKIKEKTTNTIKVEVEAKDEHSGIKNYSYSLDGEKYEEGKQNYTYSNLEKNKEYIIYIKVIDKVGNETILSMEVKTSAEEDNSCTKNCDTDGDGVCDFNCDADGDGDCDTNCNVEDSKCELNCDTNGDGKCDLNCDTDGDGKCDINCDTDNNNKCDLNCDTNGDGKCDANCDTDGDGKCDLNCSDNEDDLVIPEINLDKVPTEFLYGSKYDLPSYYKFGSSGGKVECKVGEEIYEDTSTLGIGTHVIECIAKGNNGINVRISKKVEVKVSVGIDEEWDGWIRLNLYYPENSTNWEWRIGKEGEIRDGYENTGWQVYTGPILVKLEDVEDVYIRYKQNGETYVVAPNGKVAVDIVPNKYTLNSTDKTDIEIYYDKDAKTKEYKIGSGPWQEYKGSFKVGPNTVIEARGIKEEKVYDSEGNYLYTSKRTGTDSVFISEYIEKTGGSTGGSSGGTGGEDNETGGNENQPGGSTGNGTTSGGSTGSITYQPITRPGGILTTTPIRGSKPSTYLAGPIITGSPNNEIVESVEVTVTPQEEAEKIYVSINGNNYQEYTDSITVKDNVYVKAYYIRKTDGKVSAVNYYYVQNIKVANKPYVRIDATPSNYIAETQSSVEVEISGYDYDVLEYSLDGKLYSTYTRPFTVTESSTVYARGINSVGTTNEKITIPTVTPPVEKEKLSVSIFTKPATSTGLINKTEVSITYDNKATNKYYKLAGETNYKEYTGPFEVRENTTVYAYATAENASGSAVKGIDYLTTGIMEPIITTSPSGLSEMVTVTITYDKNASKKYYQINNGEKLYYTGPFEMYENSEIYAYNSNNLGYEADNTYEIESIKGLPNYLVIAKEKYFIIKLNYPEASEESKREYKWKPNGIWKIYDKKGVLLIKPEYKEEFDFESYKGIKVEDENGNEVVFTDHYYLIDVPFSELMENLFMRWNTAKIKKPEIFLTPQEEATKEVEVGILYSSSLNNKYYKMITEDGKDTGWLEYTGPFKVTENNTVIYAKGTSINNNDSEVSSLKITNIDKLAPELTIKGDFITPKQKVTVSVDAKDDMMMSMVMWAPGEQTTKYFKTNGTTIKNPGTFTVTENGKYTIYAVDQVGNEVIEVIEITNIDKNAPDIIINVLTERSQTETEISIEYGDSKTKEYKIGKNGVYKTYTDNFIISAYEVYNLANEDGSLTIYARGTDEAGNIEEVSENIYVLDLDMPKSPQIIPSEGYPTLTKDGMIEKTESYIVYDSSRDDLINYYRVDEGEWKLYTGPISILSGKIEAKSVKVGSGLTLISEANVVVPVDAVDSKTYDDKSETETTISANTTNNFTLLNNLAGRKVRVYTNTQDTTSTIKVYSKEGKELTTTQVVNPVTVFEIPEDGYKVAITAGTTSLQVKEISLREESVIIDEDLVPVISIDNTDWSIEKVVNIKYLEGNYTKQYSIDNGESWKEYSSPFKVEEKTTVLARVLKNGKVVSGSSFKITMIDTEIPVIELNVASGIQLGYEQEIPTYYKVGESGGSAECKVGDTKVTNLSELKIGKHEIVCTAKSKAGKEATVKKTVRVVETSEYKGDSILEILAREDIIAGKYNLEVNDEIYPVHVYVYDGDQTWSTHQTFGDANDLATASTYAQNMVIVKVNGDLTINSGVKVTTAGNTYGGPKGLTLYVTGKLTNNGEISMTARGAKALGENVYLWKNADGSYEYVPAVGGAGASKLTTTNGSNCTVGNNGTPGTGRQTGGGGTGATAWGSAGVTANAGQAGTSYSGGSGSGGGYSKTNDYFSQPNGGAGGAAPTGDGTLNYGGGAGNPGGTGIVSGANGTGGLLTIYADEYDNNGKITSTGSLGGAAKVPGGSSGGGSINIFTNQNTGIDQLGIITNTRYSEILGSASATSSRAVGSRSQGGAGGNGTVNIGEIRNGQYYDLKEIIEQDKEAYKESVTIKGDSILSILQENDLKTGYYYFVANNVNYPVHLITYDGDQTWSTNQTFGDANDLATASTYAQNMVIVKVNGDLTINSGVKVTTAGNTYGGPKGLTLYVTGKLTNNGEISMTARGAKALGENVYLWKNADGSYEYVPAVGGAGGKAHYGTSSGNGAAGYNGTSGTGRQTGGGGTGATGPWTSAYVQAGQAGTSYSGGSASGSSGNASTYYSQPNGGAGGSAFATDGTFNYGGGAGNPAGTGYKNGINGTGGLLTIYADEYVNNGKITSAGSLGGAAKLPGGSSGGGSINIFYMKLSTKGTTNVTSPSASGKYAKGGAGGTGTVTYTQIPQVAITSVYNYPKLTTSSFDKDYNLVKINYVSALTSKLYSLDNGTTWLQYNEPIKVKSGTIVQAKGIKSDGTETNVITYTIPTVTDNLLQEAYDNKKETIATIPANTNNTFIVSNDLVGKNLRFFLNSIPDSEASIKIYNSSNKEELNTTFVDNLTVITIPENSYKVVINSGSSELQISEINLREEVKVEDNIPVIETSSVNWTTSKTVIITYPKGYKNEYSLDLGQTWQEYLSPITVEKATTILTRTLENGKVVSSSSFAITKIDETVPTVTLDVPNDIVLGTEYELPTSYVVDENKSSGNAICKIGEKEITTTKDLAIGTYEITCTATTGAGKVTSITKSINIIDETIDITLEIPDKILVGSSYKLPTSVTGNNYVCKIGETEYTNTESLEIGQHEIICNVTSIGGNTKEVTKQIEVYQETSSDNPGSGEGETEENSNLEEGESNE